MAQKNNVTKLDESAKVVNEVITSMRFWATRTTGSGTMRPER